MLDSIAAALSAIAALISALIGGKIYRDSTRGPDIQLVNRPLNIKKEATSSPTGVNRGYTHRLVFINLGGQRGGLISVGFADLKRPKGTIAISNLESKFPTVVETSAPEFVQLTVEIHAPNNVADVFSDLNIISLTVNYEVTTKELKTQTRSGVLELHLVD
jgi:hypothetical protein